MLKNEKIDILSICTPTKTHYEIIKYALKFSNIKAIFRKTIYIQINSNKKNYRTIKK